MNILNCKTWVIDDSERDESRPYDWRTISHSERDESRPYGMRQSLAFEIIGWVEILSQLDLVQHQTDIIKISSLGQIVQLVLFPTFGVAEDIISDKIVLSFVSDDAVVIIALPQRRTSSVGCQFVVLIRRHRLQLANNFRHIGIALVGDDEMQVVGHDHPIVYLHFGETIGQRFDTLLHHTSDVTRHHLAIRDMSEEVLTMVGYHRDEIQTAGCVVISLPTNEFAFGQSVILCCSVCIAS